MIGQKSVWAPPLPPVAACGFPLFGSVLRGQRVSSLPEEVSQTTVSLQSASPSGSGAGRSTESPSTHTKAARIPTSGSLTTSQFRGARRGAAGADGTRSGEGEAAGSAGGVNPAGRQRRARGGNFTCFRGPGRGRWRGCSAGSAFPSRRLQRALC